MLPFGRQLLNQDRRRPAADIVERLAPRFLGARPRDLGFAARMLLAVVEAADTDPWVSARTAYVLAESVLGEPLGPADAGIADLVRSYLAAFGPATAGDFGYWSGMTGAAAAVADAGVNAVATGERPLFDVSEPPADEAVRPAFVLPEFDNLLFCRKDDPDLAAAKHTLIHGSGQMHGCVLAGDDVVAHWTLQGGSPVRSDWGREMAAVSEEWDTFTRWYTAIDTETAPC